jgi:hypothetical protein
MSPAEEASSGSSNGIDDSTQTMYVFEKFETRANNGR